MEARILFFPLLAVAIAAMSSPSFISCESEGFAKWHTLTKQNFSSQIRLHHHILLIVAVPWSGESRSLMKEVAKLVTEKQHEFGSLKLMYMNRRSDKMLADAIGAAEGINVFYYRNSLSYKYRGKLNAKKIVYSILPYMSVLDGEIALKQLNSQEELNEFVETTDKAVVLFEFCGWSTKLVDREKRIGTQNGSGSQGFSGETNRDLGRGMEDQKLQGTEDGNLKCGIESGFGGIPWLGEFSSVNNSASAQKTDYFQDVENVKSNGGISCTLEGFNQFDSFFSRYIPVAREFLLSPERYRFGLVSKKSFLLSLGAQDSSSWLVMIYSNGCPSCSKILKEGDDLRSVLQMEKPIVQELQADGEDHDHAVPANKPSVLLFVDRSSDSLETRRKSKEALNAFRELALHYCTLGEMDWQNNDLSEASSVQAFPQYRRASALPRLKLSPTGQNIRLGDKMSIVIVNEGKPELLNNIASDLQGSSLHDILAYLLQKKENTKLSAVAKDAGLQLLSGDLDIKLADASPTTTEVESDQPSITQSKEDLIGTVVELGENSAPSYDGRYQPKDGGSSSQEDEEKTFADTSRHILSVMPDQLLSGDRAEDLKEGGSGPQMNKLSEELLYTQNFKGSFFFCDGNYRLLRALTGEMTIPSLAIIDPDLQQHYVFPLKTNFSYSAMEDFLHRFINGSLVPYQGSDFESRSCKEGTRPPFVNTDFHESDSIPRVTAHSFSDVVLGFNHSDPANAWNEDVLVLFSNRWCGFCQRMELVVREVHRAIKAYMKTLGTGARSKGTVSSADNLKNSVSKFPKIFLLDCTSSDCSFILKSLGQKEVYPALLLFPAEKKNTVSYDGGIAVADVIKFIAKYGSSSQHLTIEMGIPLNPAGKRGRNQELLEDTSMITIYKDDSVAKDRLHEVLLKNLTPKRAVEYAQVQSETSKSSHETTSNVGVGSILIATEKISTQPFDTSKILIVKADHSGFLGLIYNKPIGWDSLHELPIEFEMLKEAPLSFGGPVMKRGMPLTTLSRMVRGQYPEVAPGIYFLEQSATLHEIEKLKSGNQSLSEYWFFLGFSSWSPEQLLDEIADGAWNVSVNNAGLLDWP